MKLHSHYFLTAILLFATGLSGYFVATTEPHPTIHTNDKTPDRYALHFQFHQYDTDGNIVKSVSAIQAIHTDYQDMTLLFHPTMRILDKQNNAWILSATQAKSFQGGKILIGWGDVNILQPNDKNQAGTHIQTTWVKYLQDKNMAYTPKAVTITRPDSVTQGTGLIANFKTGVFQLLSNAHIIYQPSS